MSMLTGEENLLPIHYGPDWGRPVGASLALCADPFIAAVEPSSTLSRDRRTVNCPACLSKLKASDENMADLEAAERRWPESIR